MLFRLVNRVFELFRKVNEGFPEDRTGLIICRAQCKMKCEVPSKEFQDCECKTLNQVWSLSKCGPCPTTQAAGT